MGRFDAYADFIVKMMKCRRVVHGREGVADTPTAPQQAALGAAPHLLSEGVELARFSGILNEVISIRKLGTFGSQGAYRTKVVTGSHNSVKQVLESVKQVLESVIQVLESVKQVLNSVKLRLNEV